MSGFGGGLSPAQASPLSDALTPYHAIERALPHLHADSTVVVVGVGGIETPEKPSSACARSRVHAAPGPRLHRGAAADVYAKLKAGEITGRAVLTPA